MYFEIYSCYVDVEENVNMYNMIPRTETTWMNTYQYFFTRFFNTKVAGIWAGNLQWI